MIVVTRLNGGQFGVNPDLIQRVDQAPDTILTLIDGTKLIVQESFEQVVDLVAEYRASLLARSRRMLHAPHMAVVADADDAVDEGDPNPPVPLRPRSR